MTALHVGDPWWRKSRSNNTSRRLAAPPRTPFKTGGQDISDEMVTRKVAGQMAGLVREWIEAGKDESAATNRRKAAEQLLFPKAQRIHLEQCRKDRQVHSAIRLDAGESGQVIMIQPPRYQKTDLSAEEDLRKLFGDDDFGEYFRSKVLLTLDVDKLTDAQAEGLLRALGEKACCELLTVENVIKPTEQYHRDRILNDDIWPKAERAKEEGHAIPFSPSLRQTA